MLTPKIARKRNDFLPGAFLKGPNLRVRGRSSPLAEETNLKTLREKISYEEIGLFPRSFSRVFDRFVKQLFNDVENLVLQEYRFYRYLFLTTVKCIFILLLVPFLVNLFAKNYVVRPLTEYIWNTQQSEIFLNAYQLHRGAAELKNFEDKLYFESFASAAPSGSTTTPSGNASSEANKKNILIEVSTQGPLSLPDSNLGKLRPLHEEGVLQDFQFKKKVSPRSFFPKWKEDNFFWVLNTGTELRQSRDPLLASHRTASLKTRSDAPEGRLATHSRVAPTNKTREQPLTKYSALQKKTEELAKTYNDESIEAITNFFADFISVITFFFLLIALEIPINISKSFLLEVFFGLDDSKKSLLILLITDLLVGYHSDGPWAILFEYLFNHYGLPESQTGIFLLVATLPVLLDVLFKYLIFRHLNRASPATVATYHAMIE